MNARLGPLIIALLGLTAFGCKKKAEESGVTLPFSDTFDRQQLGPNWFKSGGQWKIKDGTVYTAGANNAPLFLKVKLPDDVVVEVDVTSDTPTVDSKLEFMTDGKVHQSGYIFILGGWDNQLSVIARLDEHGGDRKVRQPTGVVGSKTYRWRIEKKGGEIAWLIDGKPYMNYSDAKPLQGPGHDRLAFSNWQNTLRYDNLNIWAYAEAPPVKTSTKAL